MLKKALLILVLSLSVMLLLSTPWLLDTYSNNTKEEQGELSALISLAKTRLINYPLCIRYEHSDACLKDINRYTDTLILFSEQCAYRRIKKQTCESILNEAKTLIISQGGEHIKDPEQSFMIAVVVYINAALD